MLSACRLFQDLHSYIEERGAEVSEGSKTLTTPPHSITCSTSILGYKVLFYYHLPPSLPRSLARAEKELFSRDIGILRGQIKTTLRLSDAAAAVAVAKEGREEGVFA